MFNFKILLANIMKLNKICHNLLNSKKNMKNFLFFILLELYTNIKTGSSYFVLQYYTH